MKKRCGMAHSRLFPKLGMPYLSPMETINRLSSEFEGFQADREKGGKYVGQMLQQLKRMRHLSPPPATDKEIARLEAMQDESIFVSISDEANLGPTHLTTCIIPGQPLFFGYSSAKHELDARPLLERSAAALGYDIEEG